MTVLEVYNFYVRTLERHSGAVNNDNSQQHIDLNDVLLGLSVTTVYKYAYKLQPLAYLSTDSQTHKLADRETHRLT